MTVAGIIAEPVSRGLFFPPKVCILKKTDQQPLIDVSRSHFPLHGTFDVMPACYSLRCSLPTLWGFLIVLLSSSLSFADEDLASEMKRLPAVEAEDALDTFHVENGFKLELVASEPMVADPVDACFDEHGWMYVAEMHGYPYSEEKRQQCPKGLGKRNAGTVRLLKDTDSDGVMDKSTIFAEGISWPQSVCCYNGGVFVLAPPNLYYFEDSDGDDIADVQEVVYSGFQRTNVQALANNMKWGLDHHIWAAGGRSGANLMHRGEKLFTLGARDFRFDPKTEELSAVTGGGQFGHSFDDFGNRFICSNSNHIQHIVTEVSYLERNPLLSASGSVRTIAKEGPAAPVFRRSPAEPWRIVRTRRRAADPKFANRVAATELVPTGFFTSATGVTIYRGGAYPEDHRGNAFIGDVGGNLIHRKTLTENGVSFIATRADQNTEFITSTDTWFRPVNFVNAPDGTLYVLDMYRETIEHPYSIPEDIKAFLDLESGHDRGRIYRITPPNWKRTAPKDLSKLSLSELVAELASGNSWNRETAARLLWQQADDSTKSEIATLLKTQFSKTENPAGRVQILATLDRIGGADATMLKESLGDAHPAVREYATKIATADVLTAETISKLMTDDSVRVRRQLAFTLGDVDSLAASAGLLALMAAKDSGEVSQAVLSSVPMHADAMLDLLMNAAQDHKAKVLGQSLNPAALLPKVMQTATSLDDNAGTLKWLSRVTNWKPENADDRGLQRRTLVAIATGLGQRRQTLAKLLESDAATADVRTAVETLFTEAAATTRDTNAPMTERLAATELLGLSATKNARKALNSLLSPATPQSLQRVAIQSLVQHQNEDSTAAVLKHWDGLSPSVRELAVTEFLSQTDATIALMKAVEESDIARTDLSRTQQEALRNHPAKPVRELAARLLKAEPTGDRDKVIADWQGVVDLASNAKAGREVYMKRCSQCHRADGAGHNVGPDLISIKNKSLDDLLIAILDPNRERQPNYTSYNLVTVDGRVFAGIVVAETATAITLRQPEGKEVTVRREDIDLLKSSGKSLMPEGLEKDITEQQLADVLAFIKSLQDTGSASE